MCREGTKKETGEFRSKNQELEIKSNRNRADSK